MNTKKIFLLLSTTALLCGCEANLTVEQNAAMEPAAVRTTVQAGGGSVISSYIRSNFYQINRVPEESMLANNDLIHLVANPYSDGSLYFELPENNASFRNHALLAEFKGRNRVMEFKGEGSQMNAGADLLNKVRTADSEGTFPQFTFGTWIYIDTWTPGAYIFRKEGNDTKVALKMGETATNLLFEMGSKNFSVNTAGLTTGTWHHLAIAFGGTRDANNRVAVYVDGEKIPGTSVEADFPEAVPFIRGHFFLAENLDGKLDETFVHSLFLSDAQVKNYMQNGITLKNTDWNSSKTLACWTYDDESKPGRDYQNWKAIYDEVRSKIAGTDIKLRLGLSGGDWKGMMKNSASRSNFANAVINEIEKNGWDGVDLDFEWVYNNESYADYNATVIELGNRLKSLSRNVTFSISLHPLAYKVSKEAIDAVDFISLQVYGPQPTLFPLEKFKTEAQNAINHGIPKEKLVMGVPFYGAESNGNKATASYIDFVNAGLITSDEQDQVTYNGKTYTFNGQKTLCNKAAYVRDRQIAGIMSWDIATDVPISNPRSLLKSVKDVLNP